MLGDTVSVFSQVCSHFLSPERRAARVKVKFGAGGVSVPQLRMGSECVVREVRAAPKLTRVAAKSSRDKRITWNNVRNSDLYSNQDKTSTSSDTHEGLPNP